MPKYAFLTGGISLSAINLCKRFIFRFILPHETNYKLCRYTCKGSKHSFTPFSEPCERANLHPLVRHSRTGKGGSSVFVADEKRGGFSSLLPKKYVYLKQTFSKSPIPPFRRNQALFARSFHSLKSVNFSFSFAPSLRSEGRKASLIRILLAAPSIRRCLF